MSSSNSKTGSTPLPTSSGSGSSVIHLEQRLRQDERFNPPTPSAWKRIALIFIVVFLFWMAIRMRPARQPEVIHADRYSREHKYRPAASPIITERLKDGRIRLRGAHAHL